MSFQLTISNILDKDLGPIIASFKLPRGVSYEAKHVSDKPADVVEKKGKKKNGRASGKAKLTMTGKDASEGTLLFSGLEAFEKFEAKSGIGTVTLKMFRDHMPSVGLTDGLAKRLLQTKHLEYLNE